MALVEMSLGDWLTLGFKAGCALAVAMLITDIVKGLVMSIIETVLGGGKQ